MQITFSTSGFDGKPHFQYHDLYQTLDFSGDQIRQLHTEIGPLVTVNLRVTPDSGSTSFSLLVPHVNLGSSELENIATVGITTIHRFSIVQEFNHGQLDSYEVTQLHGTAAHVVFVDTAAKAA
jgi:hypothetical protein